MQWEHAICYELFTFGLLWPRKTHLAMFRFAYALRQSSALETLLPDGRHAKAVVVEAVILECQGFDSVGFVILKGGIPRSLDTFPGIGLRDS